MRVASVVTVLLLILGMSPAVAQEWSPLPGTPTVYVQAIKPAAAKVPVVIMLHGGGGLDKDQTAAFAKWSSWLGRQGIGSIVVDSFRGRGVQTAQASSDRAAFMAMLAQRTGDLRRATEWARSQTWVDPQRIAVFGQSQGAIVATLAALEAGSTLPQTAFYNGCDPRYFDSKPAPASYPPALWLMGGDDKVTPAAACEAARSRMGAAGQNIRLIVFPGAAHTFDWEAPERQWGGHTLRYNKAADDGARAAISEFLRAQRFL